MAVEVLEWAHEEARFVLEGRLLVAQPTDNNWRRGRTVKLAPVTAMLVTNGKVNALSIYNILLGDRIFMLRRVKMQNFFFYYFVAAQ